MRIDLNADIGEGFADNDRELMQVVSSVNIACGFHAGDAATMLTCIDLALANNVAIGAHPSFLDRENFGRKRMSTAPDVVYSEVLYQCGALAALANSRGASLSHVKPHGMLYNQAAQDAALADAIAHAVRDLNPGLILVGLAGSELIRAGERLGLATREEVFADRGYQRSGQLVPRGEPGALIEDEQLALAQTLEIVQRGRVKSVEGDYAPVNAQTVCLHGDGAHALAFARRLRAAFIAEGITVSSR